MKVKGEKISSYITESIWVSEETENTVINKLDTAKNLIASALTNFEDTIKTIREIIDKQTIDVKLVIPKWNELAGYCLANNQFRQAELAFEELLKVILKYENQTDQRLHKGSEYYNLGLTLAIQGRMKEALENWSLAYKEDIISYGETKTLDLPAKKALDKYGK